MSIELAENLYNRMLEVDNLIEAKIIKDMYDNQEHKTDMLTNFFNKKYTELQINEISKSLNNENIGQIIDCKIDIISLDDRVFPVLSLVDKDKKSIQIGLSIGVLDKLSKQINGVKATLSFVKHVGI